jgi:hypothetical protein
MRLLTLLNAYPEAAMSQNLQQTELCLIHTQSAYQKIAKLIQNAHEDSESLDKLERDLVAEVMNLGHACLQDFIDAAGDGDVGKQMTVNDQIVRRSDKKQQRAYRSVFGEFIIERYVYCRRAKTKALAKPLDQKLGLPADEVSYVLEDWLGNLSVDLPFDTVANWLEATLGIKATSSMAHRRVAKLGGFVEDFNDQRGSVPPEDEQEILVALADGKGVPIRSSFEQRAHDELAIPLQRRVKTQKDYPKSKHRHVLGDRKTQRATAGAFYSIAANVRTPKDVLQGQSQTEAKITNKRLWAEMNLIGEEEVSRGVERVFESLADESAERDPKGKKILICLMDGDRHLWSLQQKHLPKAIEILDLFHVIEKLWLAAHCFHPEASLEAERWVGHHLEMLLENKVDSVRGLLQRAINKKSLHSTKLQHLRSVYRYFSINRQRMQYGDYLAAGYPIGSGVIEGACKHVIGDRMCGTGMRWEFEGAQPMLDLRVTKLNEEWNEFIAYRIRAEQDRIYNVAA